MLAGLSPRTRRTICIQTPVKHLVRSSAHTRANRHFHKGCMSRSHLSKSDHKQHRDAALHTWDNSLWFYSRRCTVWCCNPDIEHYFVLGVLSGVPLHIPCTTSFSTRLRHCNFCTTPLGGCGTVYTKLCWRCCGMLDRENMFGEICKSYSSQKTLFQFARRRWTCQSHLQRNSSIHHPS